MAESWRLEGSYFESCNCEAACPCVFLSPPTEGECTALVGWHIDRGNYGAVTLDGLNVALAAHSPGHMAKVPWRAALYLDGKADEKQRDALTTIVAGQAGGHFAVLGEHIGEVLGVKSAPIEYGAEGKKRSLRIGDVAEAEIEAIEGQGGGPVTVEGNPLAVVPGEPAVVGRSRRLTYQDHGMSWELSDRNGFYSPFRYAGP